MILDNAVNRAAFDHEVRYVGTDGVDEATQDSAVAVEFGNGFELIQIQKALLQHVIALFADPAVLAVNHIINGGAVGQDDMSQIAQHIVGVAGRLGAYCFGSEFAIGGVVIGRVVVVEQPILGVAMSAACLSSGRPGCRYCRNRSGTVPQGQTTVTLFHSTIRH